MVLPKYKLCRARVSKAARGFKARHVGPWLPRACIICFILSAGNNGTLTALAVILLMFGLLCLLFPCCLIRYETGLTVLDPEHPNLGQKTYYLRTFKKFDDDFILLYALGSVVDGMSGYHALAHFWSTTTWCRKSSPRNVRGISLEGQAAASASSRSTER